MSDLISRQAAIEKLNERAREKFSLDTAYVVYLSALHDVETDLRHMPTIDAVPVVLCKDCRHYWKNGGDNSKGAVCLVSPSDDAFCSDGERKDDE